MSIQASQDHRTGKQSVHPPMGGADQPLPYAGRGHEPGDILADQWVTAADHPDEQPVSDFTADEISPSITDATVINHTDSATPATGRGARRLHIEMEATADGDHEVRYFDRPLHLETFVEKEGGAHLTTPAPQDPQSIGIGPLSWGLVAILIIISVLLAIAVLVAVL